MQELVGHLTAAGNITAPHFFAGFLKAGFNFDKTVDTDLRSYAQGTPADVKARYDAIITSNRKPPGPAYVALGEVMVHGEDIRRSQGTKGEHDAEHLVTLAELYKKTGAPSACEEARRGLEAARDRRRLGDGRGPRGVGPVHVVDPRDGRAHRGARRLRRAGRRHPAQPRRRVVVQSIGCTQAAAHSWSVATVLMLRVVALVASLRSKNVLLILVRP